ncbi:hypothetical protein DFH07DRAFT_954503 [Mycena maculata]|uniref:Uncharacterized protein n=1 Tax=Mycena maculata TaxID=230809 RepID=A0AAD7NNA4_9AGAR|nr:hypothetical protein DFH07DRAFT_954503 [Mycena maculata]
MVFVPDAPQPFYVFPSTCNELTGIQVMILPSIVIFGAVTIFGVTSWYFMPEGKWLHRELVLQTLHHLDGEAKADSFCARVSLN